MAQFKRKGGRPVNAMLCKGTYQDCRESAKLALCDSNPLVRLW